MIRTRAPILTAAAAVLVLLGCDSNPVAVLPDITGTYSMVEFDGMLLPVVLFEDDEILIELVSSTLILTEADTYSEPASIRFHG